EVGEVPLGVAAAAADLGVLRGYVRVAAGARGRARRRGRLRRRRLRRRLPPRPLMGMPSWRLADRTLDLEAPGTVVGAGIVNVTVDSMYEGARGGTPEQASRARMRALWRGGCMH